MKTKINLLILLLLSLAACTGREEPTPTAESTPFSPSTPTAEPTTEPTIAPTAIPPTDTPSSQLSTAALQATNWTFTPVSEQPVLAHAEEGWDSGRIEPGAVIYHEEQYHMFRNGFQTWPGATAIGYAVSEDGRSWQNIGDSPLLTSDDIPWENVIAANVTSAMVLDDGTWVLYFHTWHTYRAVLGEGFIGRATAPAPQGPWTADPDPVLRMNDDPTAWDGGQVSQASVIKTDAGYHMYYTGADANGFMNIGLATSQDGIEWQKNGPPVLGPESGAWDRRGTYQSRIIETPNGFVMLYNTFGSAPLSAYGLAFSTDGITWEKYQANPILLPDVIPNGVYLASPSLLYLEGTYRLFTEAFTLSRSQTDIYLLTLDAA